MDGLGGLARPPPHPRQGLELGDDVILEALFLHFRQLSYIPLLVFLFLQMISHFHTLHLNHKLLIKPYPSHHSPCRSSHPPHPRNLPTAKPTSTTAWTMTQCPRKSRPPWMTPVLPRGALLLRRPKLASARPRPRSRKPPTSFTRREWRMSMRSVRAVLSV